MGVKAEIHEGVITTFDGQAGYIKTISGFIYFQKSAINREYRIKKGDEVIFQIKPSMTKFVGPYQAYNINLLKPKNKELIYNAKKIGRLDKFNFQKGIGFLNTPEKKKYFLHISKYQSKKSFLKIGNYFFFEVGKEKYNHEAINCMFADDDALFSFFKNQDPLARSKYPEFYFPFWLNGYIQDKELNYITKKLFTEGIHLYFDLNLLKKIFEKLTNPSEQQTILNGFLSKIGAIDSRGKYIRIKVLASLNELDENVKAGFFKSAFNKADKERQNLMWPDVFTHTKDFHYFARKLTTERFVSFLILEKIFEKLTNPSEQEMFLNEFLSGTGEIDNEFTFEKIKFITKLNSLNKNVKAQFLNNAFNKADKERQYLMWLDGLTQRKDLNYIISKVTNERFESFFSLEKIFGKLTKPAEQEIVLNGFLLGILIIDNETKFGKIKALAGFNGLNKNVKAQFLNNAFNKADKERQYLMWLDGLTQRKDLNYIISKLTTERFINFFNPEKIFGKLTKPAEQEIVLNGFLSRTELIDSDDIYNKIKTLASLIELDINVKAGFLKSAFNKADKERQYLMWLDGLTQSKDLNYLASKLTSESFCYHSNSEKKIFKKLIDPAEQQTVINAFLTKTGLTTNENYFRKIENIASLKELDKKVKTNLLLGLFDQLDIRLFYEFCLKLIYPLKNYSYHNKLSAQSSFGEVIDTNKTILKYICSGLKNLDRN